MIYCFDIDGTICETINGDYENSKPMKKRIKTVNELKKLGHTIIFFTSRGKLTKKKWDKLTKRQFRIWGVKHDDIIFGKPYFDIMIDDKAMNDDDFFQDINVKQYKNDQRKLY